MSTSPWVHPVTLHDSVLTPTVRLEPLDPRHAPDLFAAADPELFRHSMQNPPEWSVRGFEQEMAKVTSTPGVVAFAIVLASPSQREGAGGWAESARGSTAPRAQPPPAHSFRAPRSTLAHFPPGTAIGRTTFMDIRPEHRGLEIGRTWISRPFHGTRVNPEIKFLMLRHAFESLSPSAIRVQITTSGTNLHSQHAIEKLGATREGALRDARIMPPMAELPGGKRMEGRTEPVIRDWVFYSILAAEWPTVRSKLESRLRA